MDTLPSADIEDLPIVLNYILTQKMNLRNVVEVSKRFRFSEHMFSEEYNYMYLS